MDCWAQSWNLGIFWLKNNQQKSDLTCGGNGLLIGVKKNIGLNISEFQSNSHWISCKITADLIDKTQLNIVLNNNISAYIAKTSKQMKKIGAYAERAIVSNSSGSRKKDLPSNCKAFKYVDFSDHIPIMASCLTPEIAKKAKKAKTDNKNIKINADIKNRIGGGYSSISNGPVLNTDGLRKDATRNSQSNTKWQKIWKLTKNAFPECNDIITWNEIKTVLKATPNNKAAETDGIPSKILKLAECVIIGSLQCDQNHKSHLALIILKIVTAVYENGEIPEILTTIIVVPVPNKGILTDPNNCREISLIPTIIS
ncbi:hypothetical protein BB561_005966 [Smittium simulii]|uniref:Reverse transcriptase domain-containing protein n=1 Tax=Smittium simulii TaxID=133385 RepID=A0A2T9Y786_9FUNG|nr:hypothetical protein BB561_005966 [Smittium simulii]